MTRGKFYLVFKDKYLYSTEFNGDMYPEGYGDESIELLKKVENEKEFELMISKFNVEHHNYEDEELVFEGEVDLLYSNLDLTRIKYFDFWFSDWIFIKNLSGKSIKFLLRESSEDDYECKNKVSYILKNGETVRFHFGRLEG